MARQSRRYECLGPQVNWWPLRSGQRPQTAICFFVNNFSTENVRAVIRTASCSTRQDTSKHGFVQSQTSVCSSLFKQVQSQILTSGDLRPQDLKVNWWLKKVNAYRIRCVGSDPLTTMRKFTSLYLVSVRGCKQKPCVALCMKISWPKITGPNCTWTATNDLGYDQHDTLGWLLMKLKLRQYTTCVESPF